MFGHCSAAISASRKQPRAEVRHDHRHLRETERRARRAPADRRAAGRSGDGSPSFLRTPTVSTPQWTNTAAPWSAAAAKTSLDPLVVQPVAVHRGEQADAAQLQLAERPLAAGLGRRALRRVEHEEPDEPSRMARDRGGHRDLVAGDARDERGARDAVAIELGDPAIRQLRRRSRIVPSQAVRYCDRPIRVGQIRQGPGQQLEKPRREEMTMNVAQPHDQEAIIIGLVSDTHGLVRDGVFAALAGSRRSSTPETSAAARCSTRSSGSRRSGPSTATSIRRIRRCRPQLARRRPAVSTST